MEDKVETTMLLGIREASIPSSLAKPEVSQGPEKQTMAKKWCVWRCRLGAKLSKKSVWVVWQPHTAQGG